MDSRVPRAFTQLGYPCHAELGSASKPDVLLLDPPVKPGDDEKDLNPAHTDALIKSLSVNYICEIYVHENTPEA